MHTIAFSNRIIKGINTPVITVDGFDYDTIEDRQVMLMNQINKLQAKMDEFDQMKDMISYEWQRTIDNKGFGSL